MEKKIKIKLEIGTIYQNKEGGTYYFRYQVNNERKCVSLKTANQANAIEKARNLQNILKATDEEVIAAHVKVAKKMSNKRMVLSLKDIWEKYSQHPERAIPATKREIISYESTLNEFIHYVSNMAKNANDITYEMALGFANHLKASQIAVSTHNRKMNHLSKIFSTLTDYIESNPFKSSTLRRKKREEQGQVIRRIAFTREQEEDIRRELNNPERILKNKPEIKVVFYIGMYTGQRLKDCVLMQWQDIDLRNRRINVKQFKTGKEVSIPIADPLYEVLQDAKSWQENYYVCPKVAKRYLQVDSRGKSIGDGLVNIDVLRVIKWTGLELSAAVAGRKKKATIYGFHSLRHSFASHCAEAGIPKAVVVSILGANSEIIDRFYTHVGEEAQLAAIEVISGKKTNTAQEKIDEVLLYLHSLPPSLEISKAIEILEN